MAFEIRQHQDLSGNVMACVYGTRTGKTFQTGTIDDCKRWLRNKRQAMARRAKDEAMRSIGLVKVRGALGGVYYE